MIDSLMDGLAVRAGPLWRRALGQRPGACPELPEAAAASAGE